MPGETSLKTIHSLPKPTLQRVRVLMQQRQALDAQIQEIAKTAIEMLGLSGNYDLDLSTGEVRLSQSQIPVNGHKPGNRKTRRAKP